VLRPAAVGDESGHRAALVASFLGWALDAFDFFLVVFALTAIAQEFHTSDAAIALSITVTLAFRPVGALLFGLLADRYGRRLPLMIDLVFYSIVEVLSGLAPSYRSFLVLRALFGIGMGGEWGVGASLAMEKAPARLRGVLSGLLQEGYAATFQELMDGTRWENYGKKSGNEKCRDCMVHCGYEATAVDHTFSSLKGFAETVAVTLTGKL